MTTTIDNTDDRSAEAARYAVLARVLPVLRHDVASSIQPVRMLLMGLERRVQSADPELAAITKSVMSLSAVTKKAAADSMSAFEWIDPSDDVEDSVRGSVDEAARLLALDLSASALALVNGVADRSATAPQSVLRSVFMGALLAFCDQHVSGGTLEVTFQDATANSQSCRRLHLRLKQSDVGKSPPSSDAVRRTRMIGWDDVLAMARSCRVEVVQGDGWLTLNLPRRIVLEAPI